MAITALVLKEKTEANQLLEKLSEVQAPVIRCQLIKPLGVSTDQEEVKANESQTMINSVLIEPLEIDKVELLNPQLAQRRRQRNMAFWLTPFGLIAGLVFSQMTGLDTFSNLGSWGQPLISSLLGMGSGLLGSFVAAGSVNSDKKELINQLRKKNEEGRWLIVLETPAGIELPWAFMKETKPLAIMQLSEL